MSGYPPYGGQPNRSGLPPPPGGMGGLPPPPSGMAGLPPPPSGMAGLPPPPSGMAGGRSGIPPPPMGMPRPPSQQQQQWNNGPPPGGAYGNQYQPPRGDAPPMQSNAGRSYPGSGPSPYGSLPPPPGMMQQHQGYQQQQQPQQGGQYPHQQNQMNSQSGYRGGEGSSYNNPPPPRDYPAPPGHHNYQQRPPMMNHQGGYQPPSSQPPQQYQQQHQQQQPYGGGGGYGNNNSQQPQQSSYQPRVFEMREPTNTVWLGNLEPYHTDDLIRQEFSPFGRIMRIARMEGKNFLFVHFRLKEEAQNAVATLSQRGSLGRARFNYGKQFEYTEEEMNGGPSRPHHFSDRSGGGDRGDFNNGEGNRGGGGSGGDYAGGGGGGEYNRYPPRPKRDRDGEPAAPPSNILWVGSLPVTLSTDELRQNFESFGTITNISRLTERNMAFVHFSSVEECQHALDVMRGQPIGGVMLTLNYGRPPKTDGDGFGGGGGMGGGINPNEIATNVVYLGNVASSVTHDEVDRLFDEHAGFINAKYISGQGIAFGHFDTVENAKACRMALQNRLLGGAPFRVSYGKANHTMTMADRKGTLISGGNAANGGGFDPSMVDPFNAGAFLATASAPSSVTGPGGALVTVGQRDALTGEYESGSLIPVMGSGSAHGGPSAPKYFTQVRATPAITIETRLAALAAATYHNCGEPEKLLRPNVVQTICDAVDQCVDSASEERLDGAMSYFSPLNAAHVFAICAKRLRDYFNADPHKKLHVLYACTRVLLGTRTTQLLFTRTAMWTFLVLLAVVTEQQDSAGLDIVRSIVDKLRSSEAFYTANRLDEQFTQQYQEQLDAIMERAIADQELASFAKRRRKQ